MILTFKSTPFQIGFDLDPSDTIILLNTFTTFFRGTAIRLVMLIMIIITSAYAIVTADCINKRSWGLFHLLLALYLSNSDFQYVN